MGENKREEEGAECEKRGERRGESQWSNKLGVIGSISKAWK